MIFIRAFGKVIGFVLPWETIIGVLLEIAAKLIQGWLGGKVFSKKAKYFVMARYVDAVGLGEELADDTKTSVDNDAVKHIIGLCQQIAGEQHFKLPEVEEL